MESILIAFIISISIGILYNTYKYFLNEAVYVERVNWLKYACGNDDDQVSKRALLLINLIDYKAMLAFGRSLYTWHEAAYAYIENGDISLLTKLGYSARTIIELQTMMEEKRKVLSASEFLQALGMG